MWINLQEMQPQEEAKDHEEEQSEEQADKCNDC